MAVKVAKGFWDILVARRPVRIVVGILLLLLGIAGLFLPVLQGFATIIAALAILRKDIPLAERIWQRWVIPLEQRFQRWLQHRRQRRNRTL
ncbi:MAG: PGPGW domain-containing protein [Candidatus Tectimicrobiota bacterium]